MSVDFPTGLAPLLARYDAFVFDLWGVLHNGQVLYPAVLPVLQNLRAAGKKIGILSNSPRPVAQAAQNIAQKFALTPETYDTLLTSGQLAYEALRDRPDTWLQKLGTRYFPVGPHHETSVFDMLGLQAVSSPAEADFVLVTGLLAGMDQLEDYHPLLTSWRTTQLPLLCANPDRQVMRGTQHGIASGAIAAAYAALGGDVRDDFGKPYPEIFQRMLQALEVAPAQTLMIGDNLATDILGANRSGLPNLWISGGVHAPELAAQQLQTPEQLQTYATQQGLTVTHCLPQVQW